MHAFDITLSDGRRIRVRPPQPGDEISAAALFNRLSPRSRRVALWPRGSLRSPAAVRQLFTGREAGLVTWYAQALEQPGRPVIGIARYRVQPGDGKRAELAVTVAPEFRGAGLGRLLVETLMLAALEHGVTRLVARIDSHDVAGIRLFGRLQARVAAASDGQLVYEISLEEDGRILVSSRQWRTLRFEERAGPV